MRRLTPEVVARVREDYGAGASLREIATREGACHATIRRAVLGAGGTMRRAGHAAALTWEEVTAIRLSWETRARTLGQLARRHGVSRSTIADVVYGRTWIQSS